MAMIQDMCSASAVIVSCVASTSLARSSCVVILWPEVVLCCVPF